MAGLTWLYCAPAHLNSKKLRRSEQSRIEGKALDRSVRLENRASVRDKPHFGYGIALHHFRRSAREPAPNGKVPGALLRGRAQDKNMQSPPSRKLHREIRVGI